ncbi:MAG: ribonuclease VapC [Candidatus Bathyarchaeota archaeon]
MGYDPLSVSEEQFTTSSIIEEVRPNSTPYLRLKLALDVKKLKIYTPSIGSLEKVKEVSYEVGDLAVLSKADRDVLAVALDLSRNGFSPQLVSDDYAIQNIAECLNIKYVSLTTSGIRYQFRWILYCPACKRRYSPAIKETVCEICGTKLKRKVLRKRVVRDK